MSDTKTSTDSTEKGSTQSQIEINGKTVMYIIYLLYKSNLITRNNLTMIFDNIRKPQPDDITKYLVGEEAKKA